MGLSFAPVRPVPDLFLFGALACTKNNKKFKANWYKLCREAFILGHFAQGKLGPFFWGGL